MIDRGTKGQTCHTMPIIAKDKQKLVEMADECTNLAELNTKAVKAEAALRGMSEKRQEVVKGLLDKWLQDAGERKYYGYSKRWTEKLEEFVFGGAEPGPVTNGDVSTRISTSGYDIMFTGGVASWWLIRELFGCDFAIVRKERFFESLPTYEDYPTIPDLQDLAQHSDINHAAFEKAKELVEIAKKNYSEKLAAMYLADAKDNGYHNHDANIKNNSGTSCVVCCEEERAILFERCNHVVCCTKCCSNIRECPICRTPVASWERRLVILS